MTAPFPEILTPVLLCTESGQLSQAARGWSRRPLHRCNLRGNLFRKKRWNFVCISHADVLFAVALSDADYAGLAFAWLYDLRTGQFFEMEHLEPLGRGVQLGDTLDEGGSLASPNLLVFWRRLPDRPALELVVNCAEFGGGPLDARFEIALPDGGESLNLVVPWSAERFSFNSKLVGLPAAGHIHIGGPHARTFRFSEADTAANIDFTRGVWKYETTWRWGCGAGMLGSGPDARRIGINLGAGWTDGTDVYENALFLDGRVQPLWEPVEFVFDPADLRRPWSVSSVRSDRVRLSFTPIYSRTQQTQLVLVRMKLAQVFGHYSGQITSETGEVLTIDRLPGIAENHFARW